MPTCPACETEVSEGAQFCTACGAKVPRGIPTGEDPLIGRTIAQNFRIEKQLGVGGMGKVYKAVQLSLDKPVVLKVLHPHYATDETIVHRFHREARAASRLNHPNSINIIDFGQDDDGTLFMAMEFISGRDLFTLMYAEAPLAEERIARIVMQVCSALADAHDQGVVHRDLKPENIMVESRRDQQDFVKVLDFGIAKLQHPDGRETRALTAQGMVCGTPEYMAPEQARGEDLDARTDIYALGVLLYQLATGQLPFQAENAIGIVTKHIVEKPAPPRQIAPERNISLRLEDIILRCMAKQPEERIQSVIELSAALATLSDPAVAATALPHPSAETDPVAPRGISGTKAPLPALDQSTKTELATPSPTEVQSGSRIGWWVAGGGIAALAVAAALLLRPSTPGNEGRLATRGSIGAVRDSGTPTPILDASPVGAKDASPARPPAVDATPLRSPAARRRDGGKRRNPRSAATEGGSERAANSRQLDSLLSDGNARYGAGDYEGAQDFYEKARRLAPKHPQVHLKLGMTFEALKRNEEACRALTTFLTLEPHPKAERYYRSKVEQVCAAK